MASRIDLGTSHRMRSYDFQVRNRRRFGSTSAPDLNVADGVTVRISARHPEHQHGPLLQLLRQDASGFSEFGEASGARLDFGWPQA